MGVVQKVKTQFESKGAAKTKADIKGVAKETGEFTKTQTRQAQSSASAGKQFSAQSKGLGGLVAAYAGAAATIFALQQAFSALSRAAAAEQTLAGVRALGAAIGESGEAILKSVQEITKGQLSLVEGAENVNIALSAGFNTEQIERLSGVALSASRALGRNLTDALNRVVRGTSKLEPELLDELGIFTRIEPAVEAYAAAIGKSSSSLTGFERRQAFVNAAIEEGERKFASINTTIPTSAEAIEKLATTVIDMGTQFGIFLADVITPVANYFSEDLVNAIGLFIGLGLLIMGKAIDVAVGKIEGIGNSLKEFADKRLADLIAKSPEAAAALEKINKSMENLDKKTLKGSDSLRKHIKSLIDDGKAGKLTADQIDELTLSLKDQINKTELQIQKTKKSIAATKALTNATIKQSEALTANKLALKRQGATLAKQKKILDTVAIAQTKVGRTSLFMDKAYRKLSSGVTKLGSVLSKGLSIISGVIISLGILFLTLKTLAELFGIDEPIRKWFGEIFEATKQLFGFTEAAALAEKGLIGISRALTDASLAAEGLQGITEFKFKASFLGFDFISTKTKEDLTEAVKAGITAVEPLVKAARKPTAGGRNVAARFARAQLVQQLQAAGKTLDQHFREIVIPKILKGIRDKFGEPKTWREALALDALEKAVIEGVRLEPIAEQIQFLAASSGVVADEIVQQFNIVNAAFGAAFSSKEPIKNITAVFTLLNKKEVERAAKTRAAIILRTQGIPTQGLIDNQVSQRALSIEEDLNKARGKGVSAIGLQGKLQKELNIGLINADGISRGLIAIDRLILEAKKKIANSNDAAAKLALEQLITSQKLLKAEGERQIAVEQLNTGLRKTFSSELAAADKLTGLTSKNNKLAVTQDERRKNQIELLGTSLDILKGVNKQQGVYNKLSQVSVTAQKILVGLYLKTAEALDKINKKLKKSIEIQTNKNIAIQAKANLDLLKQHAKLDDRRAKAKRDEFNDLKAQKDLQLQILQIEAEASMAREDAAADIRISGIERQISLAEGDRSASFTQEQVIQLKIKLETAKFDKIEANIRSQVNSIVADTAARKAILDAEQQQLIKDQNEIENKFRRDEKILNAQFNLQKASIKAAKTAALAPIELQRERIKLLVKEAEIFKGHTIEMAEVLAKHVVGMENAATEMTEAQRLTRINILTGEFKPQIEALDLNAGAAQSRLNTFEALINRGFDIQIKAAEDKFNNDQELLAFIKNEEIKKIDRAIETLNLEKSILEAEKDAKLGALEIERAAAERARDEAIENAKRVLEIQTKFNAVGEAIKSSFESTMDSVVKNVFEGTQTVGSAFRELAFNVLEAMRKEITDEFIIQPLINAFKILFQIIGRAVTSAISGGFISGGPIQKAVGGIIPTMAGGGRFGRDSVSALLEPGEFVVRKPAAQRIGLNNLRQMNATGNISSGNVQVNIINKGTPQEAIKTKRPKFNGENYVIDIVVRDLVNNGPIRKTLRGKGAI